MVSCMKYGRVETRELRRPVYEGRKGSRRGKTGSDELLNSSQVHRRGEFLQGKPFLNQEQVQTLKEIIKYRKSPPFLRGNIKEK